MANEPTSLWRMSRATFGHSNFSRKQVTPFSGPASGNPLCQSRQYRLPCRANLDLRVSADKSFIDESQRIFNENSSW